MIGFKDLHNGYEEAEFSIKTLKYTTTKLIQVILAVIQFVMTEAPVSFKSRPAFARIERTAAAAPLCLGSVPANPDSATMQAIFKGTVLADSDDIVKVDGNPYFPRESMNTAYFCESSLTTVCGWKGKARYWDVMMGDAQISNVVWAYDTPKPDAEKIRERFAFYRGKGVTLV